MQHRVQTLRQFLSGGYLEGDALLANLLPRAHEPFFDGGFAGEERARDFAAAKAAEGLERQRDLRLLRNHPMAACKHHVEAFVANFVFERG